MLEGEIDRLAVAPILEAEKSGRGEQRQKRRDHQCRRTRKPPREKTTPSKNRHWRCLFDDRPTVA
jgi:hypothetical protein